MQIGVQGSQVGSNGLVKFQAGGIPPGRDQVTGDASTAEDKTPKRKEVNLSFVPAPENLTRCSW